MSFNHFFNLKIWHKQIVGKIVFISLLFSRTYHTLWDSCLKSLILPVFSFSLFFFFCIFGTNNLTLFASPEINLNAVAQIESSNRSHIVGDGGLAFGRFQLHAGVIKDYNRLHNTSFSHDVALDSTISYQIANWYLNTQIPLYLRHFGLPDTLENRLTAFNMGIQRVREGAVARSYIKKYKEALC